MYKMGVDEVKKKLISFQAANDVNSLKPKTLKAISDLVTKFGFDKEDLPVLQEMMCKQNQGGGRSSTRKNRLKKKRNKKNKTQRGGDENSVLTTIIIIVIAGITVGLGINSLALDANYGQPGFDQ
jgi:hypothetical protein